jgi:hypothetical protein
MSVKLIGRVLEAKFKHPSEKWVMFVLANYAGDDGRNAYPSVATIARNAGISHRTVQTALRELVASGFIIQDGKWESINGPIPIYRILIDKLSTTGATTSPVQPLHPVQPLREGVQPLHPTGATTAQTGAAIAPNPLEIRQGSVNNRERPAEAGAPLGTSPPGDSVVSEHPAVKLWRELLKPMAKTLARSKEIADRVGDNPEDLQRWQEVLHTWLRKASNPNNVDGMLDRYDRLATAAGLEKAEQGRQGSKPGNGRQSKSGTFRRPQQAYSDEDRKRKEDEARRRMAAKKGANA